MGGGNRTPSKEREKEKDKSIQSKLLTRSMFDPTLLGSTYIDPLPFRPSDTESIVTTTPTSKQGVSTMYTTKTASTASLEESLEKLAPTADTSGSSSASSSPSAEQQPQKQKSLAEQLRDAENELCSYIYLDKGLTTTGQKSLATRGTSYLLSYTPLGSTGTTYDMLDAVAIGNLGLYQNYVNALKAAKADDSGSRTLLLKNLRTIYGNTSRGGARFPALMLTLVNLYEKAFKGEAKEAEAFVKAAQALHTFSGIPGEKANNDALAEFVKNGQTTPLTHALKDKISKIDENYKDGKPNRMDSMLNSALVKLHEDMPEDDSAKSIAGNDKRPGEKKLLAIEIMHDLHESLDMLEKMRYEVGASKTQNRDASLDTFITTVTKAKDQLQHHRDPANAKALPEILDKTSELCEQIKGFIAQNVAGTHPFNARLAVAYLDKVETFAKSAVIRSKLQGAAEGLVSGAEKKMQHK